MSARKMTPLDIISARVSSRRVAQQIVDDLEAGGFVMYTIIVPELPSYTVIHEDLGDGFMKTTRVDAPKPTLPKPILPTG